MSTVIRHRMPKACESCRARKRKCNGEQPCELCQDRNQDCVYRSQNRQGRRDNINQSAFKATESNATKAQTTQEPPATKPDESNSGTAFVKKLISTVSPGFQQLYENPGWNLFLGERFVQPSTSSQDIAEVISKDDLNALVDIYFQKVHSCYGFIDRALVNEAIRYRWSDEGLANLFDAVLAGIGAIGCLYSSVNGIEVETVLVLLCKSLLDHYAIERPSLESAIAWNLRTIYLRIAGKPEEAWMSSCITLHNLEGAILHHGSKSKHSSGIRRRVLGVARHLNVWLSFELGRSRVLTRDALGEESIVQPNDFTNELLELLPYTEALDRSDSTAKVDHLATLGEVLKRVHTQPPSVLAQCNLALCLYRRLYTLKREIPEATLSALVNMVDKGINAVHDCLAIQSPWHHVANVPFQSICALLALDTQMAFSLLNKVMDCMDSVNQTFGSKATMDAVSAARVLIHLHRRRREDDIGKQNELLKLYPVAAMPGIASIEVQAHGLFELEEMIYGSDNTWTMTGFEGDYQASAPQIGGSTTFVG